MKMKPGWKTTEFWIAIAGALVPVVNTYLGAQIPVEGLMSIAGVIGSYIVSRGVAKGRQ